MHTMATAVKMADKIAPANFSMAQLIKGRAADC